MKIRYKILLLILCPVLFTQCGIRNVTMSAMRPAEITFPSYVNNLLVVDRTKFDKKALNILEGIFTGELPGQDKASLQAAMSSFQNTIMRSPRFKVKMATERLVGNSISSAFPDPLDWSKIEALCQKYDCDAVVAIEIFDSDFLVTNGNKKVKKKVKENGEEVEKEVTEYFAEGVANVTLGFRLYDPKAKSIVDQQVFTTTHTWRAKGNSVTDAVSQLIAKTEAAKYVATLGGSDYAYKIAPMPVKITREFYAKAKSTPELELGSRKADVNDWQGAIDSWKSAVNYAKRKDAGKLCYNIAIAYEVLGDFNNAKQWASRAYVDFGNKKARDYSAMLDNRIEDEAIVDDQMGTN